MEFSVRFILYYISCQYLVDMTHSLNSYQLTGSALIAALGTQDCNTHIGDT